jgi:hypothetical protein
MKSEGSKSEPASLPIKEKGRRTNFFWHPFCRIYAAAKNCVVRPKRRTQKTLDSGACLPVMGENHGMKLARMFSSWAQRFLLLSILAASGCVSDGARRDRLSIAEASAVQFLTREVPAWSRNNGCFSCHNNGDGARALYTAMRKGYRVPARILADTTAWVAKPDRWEHNKGDPGFSDQRLANIQFAASLVAALETGLATDRQPLQEAAWKVCADQGADGAWRIEPRNVVGSPATYGTTLATYMALRTLKQAHAAGTSDAIRKAEDWLRQARPNNVLSAATLLLASAGQSEKSASPKQEEYLTVIRSGQTRDGGWGPYADSPPEPFDTAVVLLSLTEFRLVSGVEQLIRRGRSFLADRQNADGSWPATTRPPGGTSYAQRVSTTGWVTLALLATREPP